MELAGDPGPLDQVRRVDRRRGFVATCGRGVADEERGAEQRDWGGRQAVAASLSDVDDDGGTEARASPASGRSVAPRCCTRRARRRRPRPRRTPRPRFGVAARRVAKTVATMTSTVAGKPASPEERDRHRER